MHNSDVTFSLENNENTIHQSASEPWTVTLVDTGENTQTGGRLKRVKSFLDNSPFCFTYGDGVSDVNIRNLIEFHKSHGKRATVTAVKPPGRYGSVLIENDVVRSFEEKPLGDGSWISGGFFVLDPSVLDTIEGDSMPWEQGPIQSLCESGQLIAKKHFGYWQSMDTLRDKNVLEALWGRGEAPWKVW